MTTPNPENKSRWEPLLWLVPLLAIGAVVYTKILHPPTDVQIASVPHNIKNISTKKNIEINTDATEGWTSWNQKYQIEKSLTGPENWDPNASRLNKTIALPQSEQWKPGNSPLATSHLSTAETWTTPRSVSKPVPTTTETWTPSQPLPKTFTTIEPTQWTAYPSDNHPQQTLNPQK